MIRCIFVCLPVPLCTNLNLACNLCSMQSAVFLGSSTFRPHQGLLHCDLDPWTQFCVDEETVYQFSRTWYFINELLVKYANFKSILFVFEFVEQKLKMRPFMIL